MVITESVFRLYKIRATAQGTGTDSEVHSKGRARKEPQSLALEIQ